MELKSKWTDRSKGKQFRESKEAFNFILANRYEGVYESEEAVKEIQDQVSIIVNTIIDDIKEKRPILLWGDYDVDGTCSVLIWIFTLRAMGLKPFRDFDYYIPDRIDGYGLSIEGLEKEVKNFKTVITMDNGITAREASLWCQEKGVKLIVTDHHTYNDENITKAPYIFNPKQYEYNKYSHLCGSGISYLICLKLFVTFHRDEIPEAYKQLRNDLAFFAAMGTVCDFVPLVSANRSIFSDARESLKSNTPALSHLSYVLRLGHNPLTSDDFGFTIGPLLNACGRMADMTPVIRYFTASLKATCFEQFQTMKDHLLHRKMNEAEMNRIINDEIKQRAEDADPLDGVKPYLFYGNSSFHLGIVGLTATKYTNDMNIPCMFFVYGDVCKGSGRSIPGLDLLSILKQKEHLFLTLGGHEMAFGFSFEKENYQEIDDFIDGELFIAFEETPSKFEKQLQYDGELSPDCLNLDIAKRIDSIEPFGISYPKPVFKVRAIVIKKEIIGKNKEHSQVFIRDNTGLPKKIMFFFMNPDVSPGEPLEVLVSIGLSMWKGKQNILVKAVDSRSKNLGFAMYQKNKIVSND